MARAQRKTPDPLELFRRLEEVPWRYTFYQAMRWVECAHPDKPRLGESRRPADDPIRLAQEPSMSFATQSANGNRPSCCTAAGVSDWVFLSGESVAAFR